MLTSASPDLQRAGDDVESTMLAIGRRARAASKILATADPAQKTKALLEAARAVRADVAEILAANAIDVDAMHAAGTSTAMIERGTLTEARIEQIASSIEAVAELDDPIGQVIADWRRPNGLEIERVRTPLGVVGIIYESRPNVTADAGSLCVKSGNAAILRGGSDTINSSGAIHRALVRGLEAAGLPGDCVQIVPVRDRAAVGHMLAGLNGTVDVIVPRGGKGLVERVQSEARVPVFAHLEGICHVYVHSAASLDMAEKIVVNAKMRRPGICGAMETLLVDRAVIETHLAPIVEALQSAGCAVRGDDDVRARCADVTEASEEDWATEYLDAVLSVRIVDGLEPAIEHIERYGSHHTDAIVTDDVAAATRFLSGVDSAIVVHNASTQFADGGEFGMGAEIGIATGRFHARGPVGVEQLTSFKYRVHGSGQTRP
ncbi:glutamate-5-semialdehyde dehydrogenase [Amorphus orientalis]|uniref:Gamma-glutamyl phosphate reductase n=1 Tax=Amorphus orientalis TaxID=649198 RepID=A0AAE3VM82_9HYPH|nr:glutamate-5-semialdehyde dehydrogenase [Amorphus orientalis]MDQ0314626.1 glutamate-5-semialdehyde dehydrogenase [Amorphus orientalis]